MIAIDIRLLRNKCLCWLYIYSIFLCTLGISELKFSMLRITLAYLQHQKFNSIQIILGSIIILCCINILKKMECFIILHHLCFEKIIRYCMYINSFFDWFNQWSFAVARLIFYNFLHRCDNVTGTDTVIFKQHCWWTRTRYLWHRQLLDNYISFQSDCRLDRFS